jgi:hypothetical protein
VIKKQIIQFLFLDITIFQFALEVIHGCLPFHHTEH